MLVLGAVGICQSPLSQAPAAPKTLNMLWEDGEPLILPQEPVWTNPEVVPQCPRTTYEWKEDKFGYVMPTRVTI